MAPLKSKKAILINLIMSSRVMAFDVITVKGPHKAFERTKGQSPMAREYVNMSNN